MASGTETERLARTRKLHGGAIEGKRTEHRLPGPDEPKLRGLVEAVAFVPAGAGSRGEILVELNSSTFQPQNLEKVERLLDVLEELVRHPDLRGRWAMHGGTALNLFMLDVPRLSVDIDISYIGA